MERRRAGVRGSGAEMSGIAALPVGLGEEEPDRGPAHAGLGLVSWLVLAVWCGMVSGLVEVGAIVVRKEALEANRFYGMSRHFVWAVPLINAGLLLAAGLILGLAGRAGGRRGSWLAMRALAALALLPPLWSALPFLFGPAAAVVAVGAALRLVAMLERRAAGLRRLVGWSFPVVAGVVVILGLSVWVPGWLARRSERARPMPAGEPANVLLITLDTVGAGHLSLYGYERPTSPTLGELAARGIVFDRAQAPSSWTLPSHASLFTGRWPHDLSVGWFTPLGGSPTTLAEYLGGHGYATAGFAANVSYCASDSGLGRGFATYRDFVFPRATALRMASLVRRPAAGVQAIGRFLEDRLALDGLRTAREWLWRQVEDDRKDAASVQREFLGWLSSRDQPERPFFAFLNYYDAHFPYEVPTPGLHRFTGGRTDERTIRLMKDWLHLIQRGPSEAQVAPIRDAYDDCVAHLDEYLGRLTDELGRRGVLERTWVVIAGDHGESFGEHPGIFCHGMSLYQTELHVPLLIVPPGSSGLAARRVGEVVSLRELPRTIVQVLELGDGDPFPGPSLVRFWDESAERPGDTPRALAEVVPTDSFTRDPSQPLRSRWPMAAVVEEDRSYIRREGEVREELYDLGTDANETSNLAGGDEEGPELARFRRELDRLTGGPLTPERFPP